MQPYHVIDENEDIGRVDLHQLLLEDDVAGELQVEHLVAGPDRGALVYSAKGERK